MAVTNPGSNAEFKINGQQVSSSPNSISSVVEGLAFTLNETTEAGETISVCAAEQKHPVGGIEGRGYRLQQPA